MARDLTTGMLAGIQAEHVPPVFLVEAEFATGVINLWSGIGQILWDSKEWSGVGTLGQIGPAPETSALQAQGLTLSLSAIPSEMLQIVLDEIRHGKPATVWFGLLSDDGQLIVDPYQVFAGRIDAGKIQDDGNTSIATITVEGPLIDFSRSRERRYTHEDQQRDFPGDLGFEYVQQLTQAVLRLAVT